MVVRMLRNANDNISAVVLMTADLKLLCVRVFFCCRWMISASRGCLNVPGDGLTGGCVCLLAGVDGAVFIGVDSEFDS